ncbi:MAG: metallophosphoesterase family protein [bacterium]|nr:metallophosphoesterase family protein [bacterium]
MSFKKSTCFVLILLFFIVFSGGQLQAQERLSITHGPYLTDPGEDAITVVWTTNKNCVSWVEYGTGENLRTFPTWGSIPEKIYASNDGLIDAYSGFHKIRITNLESGKKYKYRVVSKEIKQFKPYEVVYGDTVTGDINEFQTLSKLKDNYTFLVTSDVHERSADLDTLLMNSAPEDFDMLFLNGDILDWFEDEEQIFKGFLDVCADRFAMNIPLIYIRGNHETRGSAARELKQYFSYPEDKYYFSFDHGSVRFIVLDSGEDKADDHPVYAGLADFDKYRSEQAEWLKREMESESFKDAEFRIAIFHMPPYSDRPNHGMKQITEEWGPILNKGNIDLVINGHTHRFARHEAEEGRNSFPVLIGGRDMLIQVDVNSGLLNVVTKGIDGKIIDSFELKKK